MNTSRDIKKLFDHFGGNAGDYQEIGRENEAKSARTRWPLLATLDFAQPAIPEIAPRRDSQASTFDTPGSEPAARPTPIHRGRPQLFTRPHRRTIPPVDAPAAQSLSALRFSALADPAATETEIETEPDKAPAPAPVAGVAPVEAPAPAEPRPAAPTFGSSVLARRTAPAASAPAATPAELPRVQPAPEAEAPSILGKLFKPQTPPAPNAPANSLQSMFDRLRHTGEAANTQPAAHRTSRLSRS